MQFNLLNNSKYNAPKFVFNRTLKHLKILNKIFNTSCVSIEPLGPPMTQAQLCKCTIYSWCACIAKCPVHLGSSCAVIFSGIYAMHVAPHIHAISLTPRSVHAHSPFPVRRLPHPDFLPNYLPRPPLAIRDIFYEYFPKVPFTAVNVLYWIIQRTIIKDREIILHVHQ